jgi:hypothetical protein
MYHTPARCGWLAVATFLALGTARSADAPPPAPPVAKTPPRKTLDLKPPSINKLYTPEQIKRLLSSTVDPDIEGVEVESSREKIINDKAPLWGVPSWILPRSDDDKRSAKPDATSPYARPPAAPPPGMAGEPRRYDR